MNLRVLKQGVKKNLLDFGLYQKVLKKSTFPGVAVLCYHGIRGDDWQKGTMAFEGLHVRVSEFEAHCRFIKENCNPVSLNDWRLVGKGNFRMPQRPVLLTFDDGYRSVYAFALPILEKYQIPAVIFVNSYPVQQRCYLWTDAVALKDGEAEVERIKKIKYEEWEALYNKNYQKIAEDNPHACLTIDEIVKLASSSLVEIGSHTARHVILSMANRSQQRDEIMNNKLALEGWIKRPVTAFAYPNGKPGIDYSKETVVLLRELGFDFAFSSGYGFAKAQHDNLELPRFLILSGITEHELAHRFCYSWRSKKLCATVTREKSA